MNRKVLSLVLVLGIAAMASLAYGQEGGSREATGAQVTQGELANILVNVLGLSRFLPAAPTMQELVTILAYNGIQPESGWEPDAVVTRAVLSRVVVLAMKEGDQVQNPEDPRSWIEYLAASGISIDTIGEAVDNLDPLPEPVAKNVFAVAATTDPLKKRAKFAEPDEREFGTDVEFEPHMQPVSMAEILAVLEQVEIPFIPPPPVTRD